MTRAERAERRERIPVAAAADFGDIDRDRDVLAARAVVVAEALGFLHDADDVGERRPSPPTCACARGSSVSTGVTMPELHPAVSGAKHAGSSADDEAPVRARVPRRAGRSRSGGPSIGDDAEHADGDGAGLRRGGGDRVVLGPHVADQVGDLAATRDRSPFTSGEVATPSSRTIVAAAGSGHEIVDVGVDADGDEVVVGPRLRDRVADVVEQAAERTLAALRTSRPRGCRRTRRTRFGSCGRGARCLRRKSCDSRAPRIRRSRREPDGGADRPAAPRATARDNDGPASRLPTAARSRSQRSRGSSSTSPDSSASIGGCRDVDVPRIAARP